MKDADRDRERPLRAVARGVVESMSKRELDILVDLLAPQPVRMLRVLSGGK